MFTIMDADTGSYVTYACSGFRPFLPSVPCKVRNISLCVSSLTIHQVSGVGSSPPLAGGTTLFHAGPQRLLAYSAADGHISIHFADPDVVTGPAVSFTSRSCSHCLSDLLP